MAAWLLRRDQEEWLVECGHYPWQTLVRRCNGDNAYIVAPAEIAFTIKGKRSRGTGSVLTAALHKGSSGWRIAVWAWAGH